MYKAKILQDEATAKKIGEFLISENAFKINWAPGEKEAVLEAPFDSLNKEKHRYWYIEDKGLIIAAMGVRENRYNTGGYEMDHDYLAVHKAYHRHGLGSILLNEVESFVKNLKGRYVHIITCDTEFFKPAVAFYEKNGYKRVAEIPDYFDVGEGRLDYLKSF